MGLLLLSFLATKAAHLYFRDTEEMRGQRGSQLWTEQPGPRSAWRPAPSCPEPAGPANLAPTRTQPGTSQKRERSGPSAMGRGASFSVALGPGGAGNSVGMCSHRTPWQGPPAWGSKHGLKTAGPTLLSPNEALGSQRRHARCAPPGRWATARSPSTQSRQPGNVAAGRPGQAASRCTGHTPHPAPAHPTSRPPSHTGSVDPQVEQKTRARVC